MKDYYQILGVTATVDDAELKSAYRKLAKEYHPDTNKAPGAEAKFKDIGEAYDTLKDSHKRAVYDASRNPSFHGGNQYGWNARPNHAPNNDSFMDIDEILRDIRRQKAQQYAQDAKNRDIVLSYAITLEEAYAGKDADLSYNLPGKPSQKIQFKIQAGIQDGIKLRFQGKGDDAMTGVKPGDLFVRISIMPHHTFVRMGQHLVTSVTINYFDALLGAEKEIPTIEGKKIKMKIPAGTAPGQNLRASGKGMPAGAVRGDMMVEVVFQPTKLSEAQRKLVEQARDLDG